MKRRATIKAGAMMPTVPEKFAPMTAKTIRELQDCARSPVRRQAMELWTEHLSQLTAVHEHNAIVARQTLEIARRILAEVLPA